MGTMDVITLDDTVDNDASLFIIDEEPMLESSPTAVMKEVTNRQTSKRKKRKSENKKKIAKKKKMNLDQSKISSTQWVVLGSNPQPSNNVFSVMNSKTASSSTGHESRTSSKTDCESISSSMLSFSVISSRSRNSNLETIVIQSDEDEVDVIELSDEEEVGTIGGELSKSVHRAQNQLSAFQMRGKAITTAWPNLSSKKHSPPSTNSSLKNKLAADRTLRPIVIDGSNVAFGHGSRTVFSSKGLQICCDYFLKRGHTVKVFVPQFRRRHRATSDFHILDKLEKEKILVFTPSRKVEGKQVVSYDDRYIVEYATKCGGVIVSRDNYQDLLGENNEWKETINKRLLMFTWVDDIIMFPNDPLGRNGPSLEEFLSFPPEMSKETTEPALVTNIK